MVGKDDMAKNVVDTSKPKKRIHISESQLEDILSRPYYSRSSHYSYSASTYMNLLHGSTDSQSIPIGMPPPLQYYQTVDYAYSHLLLSILQYASSKTSAHNGFTRLIGLIDIHLSETSSITHDTPIRCTQEHLLHS